MPKGENEENALDEFEGDFPSQETPKDGEDFLTPQDSEQSQTTEEEEEPRMNRQHRRMNQRMEREHKAYTEIREANIRESARLEALSEQRKFMESVGDKSIDERLLTLYGNDENGKKAAQLTQSLLEDTAKRAREDALSEFKGLQEREEQEVRTNEDFIDSQLESLEDEYDIDLTSNSPAGRRNRSEFLDLVQKYSPKDEDGNIREYADFNTVFETFEQSRSSPNTRQKNLASRGMVRGGNTQQKVGDKVAEAFLSDAGII